MFNIFLLNNIIFRNSNSETFVIILKIRKVYFNDVFRLFIGTDNNILLFPLYLYMYEHVFNYIYLIFRKILKLKYIKIAP